MTKLSMTSLSLPGLSDPSGEGSRRSASQHHSQQQQQVPTHFELSVGLVLGRAWVWVRVRVRRGQGRVRVKA